MKKNNHTIGNYNQLVSRIWKVSFALAFALVLSMPVFGQGEFDIDPDDEFGKPKDTNEGDVPF